MKENGQFISRDLDKSFLLSIICYTSKPTNKDSTNWKKS